MTVKFRKNRLATVARKFSLSNGSKREFPEFLPSLTDGIGGGCSTGIRYGLPSIFPARAQLFHWRYAYGTINEITYYNDHKNLHSKIVSKAFWIIEKFFPLLEGSLQMFYCMSHEEIYNIYVYKKIYRSKLHLCSYKL